MSDGAAKLEKSIRAHFAPVLRSDGFSGSGRTYSRVLGGQIQVLNVQGSVNGGLFAVNLGIQPLSIPDVLNNRPDLRRIKEYECEFRRRLELPDGDQWWSYKPSQPSMDAAVMSAVGVYEAVGRPQLVEMSQPNSPLARVTPAEFAESRFDFHGFASTAPRMARALALMRKAEGNLKDAREFAGLALKAAHPGFGYRQELLDLAGEMPSA